MAGSIGIDVQDSRTAITLLETSAGGVSTAAVGDGYRPLVPHAWTAQAWGSPAAEAVLAAAGAPAASAGEDEDQGQLPDAARLCELLFSWRRDPWADGFLNGLARRLDAYTGRTPLLAGTYQLGVCAAPGTPDRAAAAQRCESAGLPAPQFVDPADALLCRWLADAAAAGGQIRPPASSSVIAVACGGDYTLARAYLVSASGRGFVVQAGRESRIAAGTAALGAAVAGDVLARCRPGVPPPALLALLDGVLEYAAAIRTRRSAAADWSGPLAEYLFTPLRLTAGELADRPEAAGLRQFLATEPGRLSPGDPPAVIVVGGPGAAWPFAADWAGVTGPVWQSLEPELDLSIGASWWPLLRRAFAVADAPGPAAQLTGAAWSPGHPDAAGTGRADGETAGEDAGDGYEKYDADTDLDSDWRPEPYGTEVPPWPS